MENINQEHLINYDTMENSYRHCRNKYRELKKSKKHYIGIVSAENLQGKYADHLTNEKMKSMYLLCKVSNQKKSESLIKKLLKTSTQKCLNREATCDVGDSENYVYLLMR